jgi:hypothetical protein
VVHAEYPRGDARRYSVLGWRRRASRSAIRSRRAAVRALPEFAGTVGRGRRRYRLFACAAHVEHLDRPRRMTDDDRAELAHPAGSVGAGEAGPAVRASAADQVAASGLGLSGAWGTPGPPVDLNVGYRSGERYEGQRGVPSGRPRFAAPQRCTTAWGLRSERDPERNLAPDRSGRRSRGDLHRVRGE